MSKNDFSGHGRQFDFLGFVQRLINGATPNVHGCRTPILAIGLHEKAWDQLVLRNVDSLRRMLSDEERELLMGTSVCQLSTNHGTVRLFKAAEAIDAPVAVTMFVRQRGMIVTNKYPIMREKDTSLYVARVLDTNASVFIATQDGQPYVASRTEVEMLAGQYRSLAASYDSLLEAFKPS